MRDVPAGIGSGHFERLLQNHGGGDAVDVVIAVDFDRFAPRDGCADAVHRAIHIAQQKGIVQVFEAGIEKVRGGGRIAIAAAPENARGGGRQSEFPRERGDGRGVGCAGEHPAASCSSRSRRGRLVPHCQRLRRTRARP